jgi:hypothetical protein
MSKSGVKRKFEVTITNTMIVELDDAVIDAVDESWRAQFYGHIHTACDIAEHVAFNMSVRGSRLRQIDGFAHLLDSAAVLSDSENHEVEAVEITPRPTGKSAKTAKRKVL